MDYQKANQLQQITQKTAKELYAQKIEIFLNASNMKLCNAWTSPFALQTTLLEDVANFEKTVANFEYYNCCKERGKYACFWVDAYELEKLLKESIVQANDLDGYSFVLESVNVARDEKTKFNLRLNGKRLNTKAVTLPTIFGYFCRAI